MHDIRPVSATPALRAKQPAVWLPLVSHGQLPYPASITDRPKYLLSLSGHQPKQESSISPKHSDVGRVGLEPTRPNGL